MDRFICVYILASLVVGIASIIHSRPFRNVEFFRRKPFGSSFGNFIRGVSAKENFELHRTTLIKRWFEISRLLTYGNVKAVNFPDDLFLKAYNSLTDEQREIEEKLRKAHEDFETHHS